MVESWAPEQGGAVYIVKLRQGVMVYNGQMFTAEDAKWSLKRLKAVSPNKDDYGDIMRVAIRDTHAIAGVLTAPSPIFLAIMPALGVGTSCPRTSIRNEVEP